MTKVKVSIVQDFKQRRLQVVKGSKIPDRWLYMDTETKTELIEGFECERFYIGWTCMRETFSKRFGDITEWCFWKDELKMNEYLQDIVLNKKPLYLVGHNIFFDLQACGFFDYFTHWGWVLDFVYDKGLTYILRCKKDKSKLTIISTTNYFDQSLKKLGQMVKLPKLDVDFGKASLKHLKVYCKRDVDILIKAMKYYISFLDKHKLGSLGMTKSSQAFISYRHRFMYNTISLHSEEAVTQLERKAYIGGRVECYRLGKIYGGPFVSLDFNSMYSYVMSVNEYPSKLVEYNQQFEIERYKEILRSFSVVACIEVDTPENCYAVHYKGKIVFPIGNFCCYVCSTGLKYAIDQGHIKRIIEVAIYKKIDLFSKYVNYFYDLKLKYDKDNNLIMKQLCKYMLNSLYGKFGQKGIVRNEYDVPTGRTYYKEDIWDPEKMDYVIIIKLMNKLIYQYHDEEGENAFPGITAHITENARFVLWNLIKNVGQHKVLYCDTDSIKICTSDLHSINWTMHDNILGALKTEETSNELFIGGCKNYRTEKKRTIKGIPNKAIEIAPNIFRFDSFGRQNIHLRKEMIKGVIVKKTTRTLRAEYLKGNVSEEGIVTPFRFSLP